MFMKCKGSKAVISFIHAAPIARMTLQIQATQAVSAVADGLKYPFLTHLYQRMPGRWRHNDPVFSDKAFDLAEP